jgi:hypothetical protein
MSNGAQGEPLQEESSKHDREGDKDDEVAKRKGRADVAVRQGQRRHQGDDPPHAAPRDDETALDGRRHHRPSGVETNASYAPVRDGVVAHDPGEPYRDDRCKVMRR